MAQLKTASNQPDAVPALGARVVIRDAEWVVRRVDMTSGGAYQLVCDGVSELVRGQESVFLSALENIEVLDPATTRLVPDESPGFQDSLLYMESLLRQAVASDEQIHIGHEAAMDSVPYQLVPARQALSQPRQRILIADAVGLGKTLEAGVLVSELIARGRGRRILVLAVKSMLTQFQKEFWNRFTIPLTRLDSVGIQRVRSRIPTNHNPFYYYDKAIISIDTLKQDAEYRTYLENANWDIIVIDEAHNVAERGSGSLRSRLARLLSQRSDTLIMLSATPHDGRARSFASLINMLDATAIADPERYAAEDITRKGLVIRRFKKDIRHEVRAAFRDREIFRHRFPASPQEESAYEALLAVKVAGAAAASKRRDLFAVSLEKALFSSPFACLQTVNKRIQRRQEETKNNRDESINGEVESLQRLRDALTDLDTQTCAKYQALLAAVVGGRPFQWKSNKPSDRLVIFTERIETLHWLERELPNDLKLSQGQLGILHGGMSDVEQQRVVDSFGNLRSRLRLLLCSDVASEGINLHYQCHRLIHFDMPWSLMAFQQRNGRVDRYGQDSTPQIVYLVTESSNPIIQGDTRVLEVLSEKDEQAYRNIGDPSAFMNVHDIETEEKITTAAIARSESAESFNSQLTPKSNEGDNLLALFLGATHEAEAGSPIEPPPVSWPSLYSDDLRYCNAALNRLRDRRRDLQFELVLNSSTLTLDAPDDLRARFSRLPREIFPDNGRFALTTDRMRMNGAIADSRRNENAWPRLHYLWRLHPVVGWLNERMLAAFGRHEAPVIAVPRLPSGQVIFLVSGLVPNRKSHPLIYEWLGVVFRNGQYDNVIPFEAVLELTGLGKDPVPNRNRDLNVDMLENLLPIAVEKARERFLERRNQFENAINERLDQEVAALDEFKLRQSRQLEFKLARTNQPEASKRARAESESKISQEIVNDYWDWIESTMTTEKEPSIKVVCVIAAPG